MNRAVTLPLLLLLVGCGQRLRIASPQITRNPPMVTCIIVVDTQQSEQAISAAADVCKQAIDGVKR